MIQQSQQPYPTLPTEPFPMLDAGAAALRTEKRPRVLVVDDERLIRWYLAEKLGGAGYEVVEAEDGETTERQLTAHDGRLDLVILDMKLPDTDGLRLLARIKAKTPSCPVVLMTAYGTADTREEAVHLGADGFVEKPFEASVMLSLASRLLDRGDPVE